MKTFFRFYKLLSPYKWRMLPFLAVLTVAVAAESVRPYWLKLILESADIGDSRGITLYFILFGASIIGSNLISALSFAMGDTVMVPFTCSVREQVFKKVLDLDFAYHAGKSTGSLISAFRRGDSAVFDMFFNIHQELYRVVINLLVTVYFLWLASWEMAALLLLVFIVNLALILWLIKINLKTRSEFNKSEDNVSAVITDSLINYETVKYFASESKELKHLQIEFEIWSKNIWRFFNSFRLMDITIGTTAGLGMLAILWLAIARLNHGFSVPDLVMVAAFITGFYYQFFNLFFRIRNIAKSITDLDRYFKILEKNTVVADPPVEVLPKEIKGEICFSNVSFHYPDDPNNVLDKIDLTISPGQRLAFAGRSGAGKTTLIKLLLRFYDPTQGQIFLDGVDIRQMNKSTLRSFMGIVPQEPIMFNNTLKYNLAYAKISASQNEIETAARQANILDFIEHLPEKWSTQVGERGIKLSGGQKQRLAIARALLANPKVLIFDEATSHLDSESEGLIQKALDSAARDRTVILIAHRFSTIRNADQIVVLNGGCISEIGTHDQLQAKKGVYQTLWELQSTGQLIE